MTKTESGGRKATVDSYVEVAHVERVLFD